MRQNLQYLLLFFIVFASCQSNNTENVVTNAQNDTTKAVAQSNIITSETDTTNTVFMGDLNGDSEKDKIELVEKPCPESDSVGFENPLCRTIVIYLAKNGGFEQFAANSEIVDCSECGGAGVGDPFRQIVIKNGYFTIEQLFGASVKTYLHITFKYNKQDKDFFLHKVSTGSYSSLGDENGEVVLKDDTIKTTKNFGKIKFADFIGDL